MRGLLYGNEGIHMKSQVEKAQEFADLHVKGNPVIIYNAWDGGSAKTITASGAKAIATGDHPVGFAHGFGNDDFADFTFDIYLPTIKEIAGRIGDLPYSVDINNANELVGDKLQERVQTVIKAGAVGVNFEDSFTDGHGLHTIEEQSSRIQTVRAAAESTGVPLFINARTDLFAQADKVGHAVKRAEAYQAAGANGFFVPGLFDLELITQLTERVDLPVNIIRLPGAPSTKELIVAGVSRISYGPVPQMAMTEWLTQQATLALNGEV
jgi:2-methylisocitrate lyase-like PEP mutase family enzyme